MSPIQQLSLTSRRYVIAQNEGAQLINQLISKSLISHPLNLFEIALHPEGLAAHTLNFEAWGSNLLHQLNRLVQRTADPELKAIESTVLEYPNVRERLTILKNYDKEDLASMPIELNIQNRRYSFIITQASFGPPLSFPQDQNIIELFYPADEKPKVIFVVKQAFNNHNTINFTFFFLYSLGVHPTIVLNA